MWLQLKSGFSLRIDARSMVITGLTTVDRCNVLRARGVLPLFDICMGTTFGAGQLGKDRQTPKVAKATK